MAIKKSSQNEISMLEAGSIEPKHILLSGAIEPVPPPPDRGPEHARPQFILPMDTKIRPMKSKGPPTEVIRHTPSPKRHKRHSRERSRR